MDIREIHSDESMPLVQVEAFSSSLIIISTTKQREREEDTCAACCCNHCFLSRQIAELCAVLRSKFHTASQPLILSLKLCIQFYMLSFCFGVICHRFTSYFEQSSMSPQQTLPTCKRHESESTQRQSQSPSNICLTDLELLHIRLRQPTANFWTLWGAVLLRVTQPKIFETLKSKLQPQ